jgi:hypothetical protein
MCFNTANEVDLKGILDELNTSPNTDFPSDKNLIAETACLYADGAYEGIGSSE